MNLLTLKLSDQLIPYNQSRFREFINLHLDGLDNWEDILEIILEEVELTISDGLTIDQLIDSSILVATQNIQENIDFDKVSTRLLLTKMYRTALSGYETAQDFTTFYQKKFKSYLSYSYENNLLSHLMRDAGFNLKDISRAIKPERDDIFKFIGLTTAQKRYLKLDWNQFPIETPQFMWMRIAMWMSLYEENKTESVIRFYEKLSNLEYIPGGSTNIGAGTNYPVLSNCYLLDTDDDIDSIFDNIKNIALISKATGGMGISVTKLRASGSPVKSNNTFSTGPIPFIKVMDTALRSMSRAGKKYGALAIYMENWHIDFMDFMDLRQNAGDDYRRIRTADTAVYISDEFMKRVINNDVWYMFDPAETPDLTELYGSAFSKRYKEYCEMADRGEITMFKTISAVEQFKRMLASLLGTSHPWITWKDPINVRALNNNTGTIHCSNLCTEICLPQDRENISVCNLAYINLTQHINFSEDGDKTKTYIDWERLEETTRVSTRYLDNLIDVNQLNVKEAKKSDSENRAVGLGLSGFAESIELFGYPYDSKEAFDFADRVFEFISYYSIDESCKLAEERGSYKNFEGSMWSKGFVPYDTIKKVALDREGGIFDEDLILDNSKNTVEDLKLILNKKLEGNNDVDLVTLVNELLNRVEGAESELKNFKSSSKNNIGESEEVLLKSSTGISLRQDISMNLDWDLIRTKVKKGIRNATLMAIAPNASTGLVLGTTPGIDVRFAQIFSRNTYNGNFLDINHNLVRDLKTLGIWDKVKSQVLASYGDVSEIDEIPDDLKLIYKTSFQVSPYAAIEVASRAQKWIDQSMSRNMYLQTRDLDELAEIYTEAWRRGIKTTYYLHTKPRHKAEQSTVKVNKREELNKSGFGSLSLGNELSTTNNLDLSSQTSFVEVERKGFGFADTGNKLTSESEVFNDEDKNENTEGEIYGGGGRGGFSKYSNVSVKAERVNFKRAGQMDLTACPLDPAERANCESCQ